MSAQSDVVSRTESAEFVRYEEVDDGSIAVVTLDRPEARNAQNKPELTPVMYAR